MSDYFSINRSSQSNAGRNELLALGVPTATPAAKVKSTPASTFTSTAQTGSSQPISGDGLADALFGLRSYDTARDAMDARIAARKVFADSPMATCNSAGERTADNGRTQPTYWLNNSYQVGWDLARVVQRTAAQSPGLATNPESLANYLKAHGIDAKSTEFMRGFEAAVADAASKEPPAFLVFMNNLSMLLGLVGGMKIGGRRGSGVTTRTAVPSKKPNTGSGSKTPPPTAQPVAPVTVRRSTVTNGTTNSAANNIVPFLRYRGLETQIGGTGRSPGSPGGGGVATLLQTKVQSARQLLKEYPSAAQTLERIYKNPAAADAVMQLDKTTVLTISPQNPRQARISTQVGGQWHSVLVPLYKGADQRVSLTPPPVQRTAKPATKPATQPVTKPTTTVTPAKPAPVVTKPVRTPSDAVNDVANQALRDSLNPTVTPKPTTKPKPKPKVKATPKPTLPAKVARPDTSKTEQQIADAERNRPRYDDVGRPVDAQGKLLPGGITPPPTPPTPPLVNAIVPKPETPSTAPSIKPPQPNKPTAPLPSPNLSPEGQKSFDAAAAKSLERMLEQRAGDYAAGRSTREQALAGLQGDDLARMAERLNKLDASRGVQGGGNSGNSGAAGSATVAEVKSLLDSVRAQGGIGRADEALVRRLTGLVESAQRQPGLSADDSAYLNYQLNELRQEQTHIHSGRALLSTLRQAQAAGQSPEQLASLLAQGLDGARSVAELVRLNRTVAADPAFATLRQTPVVKRVIKAQRVKLLREVNELPVGGVRSVAQARAAFNNPPHWQVVGTKIGPQVGRLTGEGKLAWDQLTAKFGDTLALQMFDANLKGGAPLVTKVLTAAGVAQTLSPIDCARLHFVGFTDGGPSGLGSASVGKPSMHDAIHSITGYGVNSLEELGGDKFAEGLLSDVFDPNGAVKLDPTRSLSAQPAAAKAINGLITGAYNDLNMSEIVEEFNTMADSFWNKDNWPQQSDGWELNSLANATRAEQILNANGALAHLDEAGKQAIHKMIYGPEREGSFEAIALGLSGGGSLPVYRAKVEAWVERVKAKLIELTANRKMPSAEFTERAEKAVAMGLLLNQAQPGVLAAGPLGAKLIGDVANGDVLLTDAIGQIDLRKAFPAALADVRAALATARKAIAQEPN